MSNDDLLLHEALDRCSIVLGIIDDVLLDHSIIINDAILKHKIETASDLISECYQELGRRGRYELSE